MSLLIEIIIILLNIRIHLLKYGSLFSGFYGVI